MLPLTDRVYDVAIIGGGILGLSVARDCAMRRLSVVLFEKEDFASGTTGAGAGILSGEPHWLSTDPETTRTACEEINVFQRIAPNLLTRVPILFPVLKTSPKYELDRVQALADLYDHYASAKAGRPHVRLNAKEMQAVDPGLSVDCWGAISVDEWTTDPARITIATARSAAAAGAALHKGVLAEKIEMHGSRLVGVRVKPAGGSSMLVRARTVVNAAGPWGPALTPARSVEFRSYQRSYLFLERRVSEVAVACPLPHRTDPLYFFPRENISIIGPSESPFNGDPENPQVSEDEVNGMLDTVKKYFPRIESHRFTAAVSGIHCRIFDIEHQEGQRQAAFDHASDGAEGVYTLIGGGLTRARRLAEQVTNAICKRLRQRERCRTHLESLPGCTSEIPWLEESRRTGRDPLLVARLIRRYGHKAEGILDAATRHAELGQTLCECEQVLAAEVEYAVRKEWVTSLADLRRRTRLGNGSCQGCRCLRNAACFLGSQLKWNSDEVEAQIAANTPQFPLALTWQEQLKQRDYARSLQCFGGTDG